MDKQDQKNFSLTKQSAWLLFAKITGFVLSFLLPFLVVRYLSQDKVGLYKQAFQVIANGVSILPLGFSMSAYYFLNREPEKRALTISNILLFNLIVGGLACLTLLLYPQLLGNLFHSDEMTRLAPRIGLVIWLWIFATFLEIVALANQETRTATVFIISAQFTRTVLMAGAVILFSSIESFIYAAIAQGILQTAILLFYLNSRYPRFWKHFDFAFFREQIIYAIPFGLAGLLYTFQTDIHNYFVGNRFSQADYAIYSYGCFELPLIAMLYESISAVMIPRMSEMQAQGKKREMILTTVSAMQKLAFVYFPLFTFMMIVAPVFITTLFTEKYAASVPIFRINLLLIPLYILMLDPIGRAFPEVGRFLLKVRSISFFFLLAALWFGVQYFDLRGMIAIVVLNFFVELMFSLSKTIKVLEVRPKDFFLLKNVGKTAAAAILAGVFLFAFYFYVKDFLLTVCLSFSHNLLALVNFEKGADFFGGSLFLGICLLLFAVVYLTLISRLGALEKEDKERFWSAVRKLTRRGHRNITPAQPPAALTNQTSI